MIAHSSLEEHHSFLIHKKSRLIGKDPDSGKDREEEEQQVTDDKMTRQAH